MRQLLLIAGREVSTRLKSKSFVISTLVTLGIFAVIGLAPSVIGHFSNSPTIAVDSAQTAQVLSSLEPDTATIDVVDSASAAEKSAADGDAVLGLAASNDGGYTAYVTRSANATLLDQVTSVLQANAQQAALASQGVDFAAVTDAMQHAIPTQVTVGEAPVDFQQVLISFVISLLLFMQILTYGSTVAQGVVEEKASRIVEILLSTVSARTLMVGKVLGIGLVGLVQLAIYLTAGMIVVATTRVFPIDQTILSAAGLSVLWFIPGYLFYAFAWGAAGSMVSRQEEIGSTTTVLMMLTMVSYFAAIFALQDVTAAWVQVLSFIPPFSAILMPMMVAAGSISFWPGLGAYALLIVATGLIALACAAIYRRSVLQTGSRVKLSAILRRAS